MEPETDCFGCELWHTDGTATRISRINRVVTNKPKTIEEIMDEMDDHTEGAIRSHLNNMVRGGCFTKVDGRYSVIPHPGRRPG